jgi:hypothetical protein
MGNRKLIVLIVIVIIISAYVFSSPGKDSKSKSNWMSFVFDGPVLDMKISFQVNITWDQQVTISKTNLTEINYIIRPGPASISFVLPLGLFFGWMGWGDTFVSIPLGDTPLGSKFISWSPPFLSVFAGFFDIGLDINSSIVVDGVLAIISEGKVLSIVDPNVEWEDYGQRHLDIHMENHTQISENVLFAYNMKLGVSISILKVIVGKSFKYPLIPETQIFSINSDLSYFTSVQSVGSIPYQDIFFGVMVVSGVLLAIIIVSRIVEYLDNR